MFGLYQTRKVQPIKHFGFDEEALKKEVGVTELFGEKGFRILSAHGPAQHLK